MTFSPGDPFYLAAVLAAITFFAVLLLMSLRRLYLGRKSERWKPVRAVVESVMIDYKTDSDNDTWFKPGMKYSFRAPNGQTVRSTRVSYRSLATLHYGDVAESMTGVVPGKEIRVYYNPKNPKQSVFNKGVGPVNYLEPLFIAVALWFAVSGFQKHLEISDRNNTNALSFSFSQAISPEWVETGRGTQSG